MSAGWNLYQAGTTNGLSSTASTVTTSSKYFKASSEYSFSFPQLDVDFGAFLAPEPETGAGIIGIQLSLCSIIATTFATYF